MFAVMKNLRVDYCGRVEELAVHKEFARRAERIGTIRLFLLYVPEMSSVN